MKNKLVAYLKDETGQTSTEYILLVAVVAAIVFKFRSAAMTALFGGEDGDGMGGVMGKVFNSDKLKNF